MLEFEKTVADASAYFQPARIPRKAFRPWALGRQLVVLNLLKGLNYTWLISKDFLKLRGQVNLEYGCELTIQLYHSTQLDYNRASHA